MYTMTLSDGTKIENLELNGNNWISGTKLTENDFEGKLNKVTVTDGITVREYSKQVLVQVTEVDGKYWFVLRDKTREEELEESVTELQVALADAYEQMLSAKGGN